VTTTSPHPTTWLVCWIGFAVGVQASMPPVALLALSLGSLLAALFFARHRVIALLWRTRWIFLSLAILFPFFTPGEYLAGFPAWAAVSYEGTRLAVEQILRLLVLLSSLTFLHERLGTQGMLVGLHALLKPFRGRDATVVRLMLILEHAEERSPRSWRAWLAPDQAVAPTAKDEPIHLPAPPLQTADRILMTLCCAAAGYWIFLW